MVKLLTRQDAIPIPRFTTYVRMLRKISVALGGLPFTVLGSFQAVQYFKYYRSAFDIGSHCRVHWFYLSRRFSAMRYFHYANVALRILRIIRGSPRLTDAIYAQYIAISGLTGGAISPLIVFSDSAACHIFSNILGLLNNNASLLFLSEIMISCIFNNYYSHQFKIITN